MNFRTWGECEFLVRMFLINFINKQYALHVHIGTLQTVFQAKILDILECCCLEKFRICICWDSLLIIKALASAYIYSGLSVSNLWTWVPGHIGVKLIKIRDELANKCSSDDFPEPCLGLSKLTRKTKIRMITSWINSIDLQINFDVYLQFVFTELLREKESLEVYDLQ